MSQDVPFLLCVRQREYLADPGSSTPPSSLRLALPLILVMPTRRVVCVCCRGRAYADGAGQRARQS